MCLKGSFPFCSWSEDVKKLVFTHSVNPKNSEQIGRERNNSAWSVLDFTRSFHGKIMGRWQSRSLTCVHIVGDSHCKTTDGGTPQNKLEEQRYRNKFQDKPEHAEEDENLSHLYRFLVLALLALFLVSSVSSFCLQDTITQPSELRSLLPSLDPWISTTFTVLSAI